MAYELNLQWIFLYTFGGDYAVLFLLGKYVEMKLME